TEDQQKAIDEIIRDLQSGKRVNRLLQGDVGSGKTIVAIVLQYLFHLCGYQSVMMAPTELLANQHGESIKRFFADTGLSFALLKGKMSDAEKEKTMEEIASGKVSLVIGTHALIQSSVRFHRLGLIITDEQHRFGVEQRKSLYQKSSAPHKVVMSATPIPRTISHVIYGDLDLSLIKTMPKGRKPVKTYCCRMSYLKKVFQSMEKEFLAGRQAFIVCPEIEYDEEPEKARTYSLEYVYEKIQGTFLGKYRIGILHGKMKKEEKDEVMQRFRNRELDLLIATTVIEVGIDVSNATVILVLSAERFGLSTLHQLRGRVGRGDMQGYCFFATDSESEKAMQRMKVLTEHQDGFAIAEEDLRLRGPGDYFGLKQHGMPGFELTNLSDDFEEIELARGIISTLNEEQKRFYTKKFKEKTNLD
ncbi:MAG TPA: ATP-dependent DNA helicase RecG, partial [Eubacteriaceae bacterium]|nr:ATP-dependent DNA helicase RecG [Eubacteriaceae bacterium]